MLLSQASQREGYRILTRVGGPALQRAQKSPLKTIKKVIVNETGGGVLGLKIDLKRPTQNKGHSWQKGS